MKTPRMLGGALLGLAALAMLAGAIAAQGPRQYYGRWSPSGKGYHYCHYYFKPAADDPNYQHHYVIYYASTPRYVYYYNPESRVYWGRYDCQSRGYSMLPPATRKAALNAIPEKSFPPPAALPPIPQSKDNTPIAPPPDPPADLPAG